MTHGAHDFLKKINLATYGKPNLLQIHTIDIYYVIIYIMYILCIYMYTHLDLYLLNIIYAVVSICLNRLNQSFRARCDGTKWTEKPFPLMKIRPINSHVEPKKI